VDAKVALHTRVWWEDVTETSQRRPPSSAQFSVLGPSAQGIMACGTTSADTDTATPTGTSRASALARVLERLREARRAVRVNDIFDASPLIKVGISLWCVVE